MLISNVVITHDRREFIYAHLCALPRQTHQGFEVVVVCDNCSDGTVETLEALAPCLPYKIRILETPASRRGIAAATNIGIEAATGELVILNDDDVIPHHRCFEAFVEDMAPGIAGMGYVSEPNHRRQRCELEQIDKVFLFRTGNVAVWRDDLLAVGGMDEQMTAYGWQDHDLGYRLHRHGVELRYMDRAEVLDLWSVPGFYVASPESRDTRDASMRANAVYLRHKYGRWPPGKAS